jgi:magnesium chelatase family protein
MDIHLEVPSVPYKDLCQPAEGVSSAEILERVVKARDIQNERFKKSKIHTNAGMSSRQIRQFCRIDEDSGLLLEKAMNRFALSARAHGRILKIARTIADLEEESEIRAPHVAEAIQYRTLDRKMMR